MPKKPAAPPPTKMQRVAEWARTARPPRFVAFWLLAYLPLTAFYFSEVLAHHNYLETFAGEMAFPLAMHALTALFIAGLVQWVRRPAGFAGKLVTALVLGLLMVNYNDRLGELLPVFRAVLPILPEGNDGIAVVSALVLVLLAELGILAGAGVEKLQAKYPKTLTMQNVSGAVAIIAGFLFVGQALPVLRMVGQLQAEGTYQPSAELREAEKMQPAKNAEDNPDIYYLVFDRYASNDVLQAQFGYDNSEFLDGLRAQGFNVDDNAYSNYPYTAQSIASVLNMGYHSDDTAQFAKNDVQAATIFHSMIRSSQAIKLLKEQGYSYYNVGSTYGATNKAPLADTDYAWGFQLKIAGQEKRLRGLEATQFTSSPYYAFTQVSAPWWPAKLAQIDPMPYVRNQLTTLKDLSAGEPGGRFIFAHVLAPHEPYFFNADGSRNPDFASDNLGKPIKKKYTNQVQFVNQQLDEILQNIREKSGDNAVVILMSDEGPYPMELNKLYMHPITEGEAAATLFSSDMREWPKEDLAMKFGILQAVHIPKATPEDLEHMAPVNAFRIVLNRYFGYSYEYLPSCQIGLPDGRQRLYKSEDITQLVTGQKNDACTQL
jgi:hypothetical protein